MHYINPTKSETVEEGLTVCFNEFFKLLQWIPKVETTDLEVYGTNLGPFL
jgi:hypothetical protein